MDTKVEILYQNLDRKQLRKNFFDLKGKYDINWKYTGSELDKMMKQAVRKYTGSKVFDQFDCFYDDEIDNIIDIFIRDNRNVLFEYSCAVNEKKMNLTKASEFLNKYKPINYNVPVQFTIRETSLSERDKFESLDQFVSGVNQHAYQLEVFAETQYARIGYDVVSINGKWSFKGKNNFVDFTYMSMDEVQNLKNAQLYLEVCFKMMGSIGER